MMRKLNIIRNSTHPSETEMVEFKQSLGEWREIVETCAAFATAKGGCIHVDVDNKGKVTGVEIGKGTIEDITNKIVQNTNPRVVPSVSIREKEGKSVVVLNIKESPSKPVYAFDRPYRRSGRSNQRLSPEEAAHLYLESRGITWDETLLPDASVKDINAAEVKRFVGRARRERRWNVEPDAPVKKVLKQLGLFRGEKGTVAAILLFGKNPQRLMAQSVLRCARFKGDTEVEFLDMKVIEGNIVQQVEEAVSFVKRNISMAVIPQF